MREREREREGERESESGRETDRATKIDQKSARRKKWKVEGFLSVFVFVNMYRTE